VRTARWIGFAVAAAAMIWRQPAFFTAPRFWAEDAPVYFANAWMLPWWRAVVYTPQGYLAISSTLAAQAAVQVPLEHAPLVTTLVSFLTQLLAVGLVVFGRAPEWRGWRWLVGLAIVLFAGLTDEVWLNVANLSFWWGLVAFLLLLEPVDVEGGRAIVYRMLIALAFLSSPVAVFLAPLFVLRAWQGRTREAIVQATIAGVLAAVQVAAVATGVRPVSVAAARSTHLDVQTIACGLWMKAVVLPALGERAVLEVRNAGPCMIAALDAPSAPLRGVVLVLAWLGVVAWLGRGLPPGRQVLTAGAYVLVSVLSLLGALGDKRIILVGAAGAASRYAYVPSVIFLVLLFGNVRRPVGARAVVAAGLLATGLALGALRYPYTVRWDATWPDWRAEVAAWRRNPYRGIATWPSGWGVRLPPRPR
jgi:hypothetical protein